MRRCIKTGNPCALHATGKYKNWPCDIDGYSTEKRYQMFLKRKNPCPKCGKLKAPESKFCFVCTPRTFKYKGKKLPEWWRKRIAETILRGERAWNWKGGSVDYSALHHWVRREKGHPSACSSCGLVGKKVGRAWNIQWANKSGLYLRELADWIPLCFKCHATFDKGTEKRTVWDREKRDMHLLPTESG